MISLTSSINSESFSNFGQSHGWSGTFPMDLPTTTEGIGESSVSSTNGKTPRRVVPHQRKNSTR